MDAVIRAGPRLPAFGYHEPNEIRAQTSEQNIATRMRALDSDAKRNRQLAVIKLVLGMASRLPRFSRVEVSLRSVFLSRIHLTRGMRLGLLAYVYLIPKVPCLP